MIVLLLIVFNGFIGFLFIQYLIDAIKSDDKEEFKTKKLNASINFVLWSFTTIFLIVLGISG
ncbi:hypothetical protein [Rossellomorea aquimaris]|uniref:hypothetical protein n=1 Tax=Rossellomorea aquimaris TaxID=189382 RepID=UPI0007D04966|nr:hypothetical protein [Rossellomorea aquimaris]